MKKRAAKQSVFGRMLTWYVVTFERTVDRIYTGLEKRLGPVLTLLVMIGGGSLVFGFIISVANPNSELRRELQRLSHESTDEPGYIEQLLDFVLGDSEKKNAKLLEDILVLKFVVERDNDVSIRRGEPEDLCRTKGYEFSRPSDKEFQRGILALHRVLSDFPPTFVSEIAGDIVLVGDLRKEGESYTGVFFGNCLLIKSDNLLKKSTEQAAREILRKSLDSNYTTLERHIEKRYGLDIHRGYNVDDCKRNRDEFDYPTDEEFVRGLEAVDRAFAKWPPALMNELQERVILMSNPHNEKGRYGGRAFTNCMTVNVKPRVSTIIRTVNHEYGHLIHGWWYNYECFSPGQVYVGKWSYKNDGTKNPRDTKGEFARDYGMKNCVEDWATIVAALAGNCPSHMKKAARNRRLATKTRTIARNLSKIARDPGKPTEMDSAWWINRCGVDVPNMPLPNP